MTHKRDVTAQEDAALNAALRSSTVKVEHPEVARLRAELEAYRRDAERYRWLLNAPFSAVSGLFIKPRSVWNSAIDAQDAALAAKGE